MSILALDLGTNCGFALRTRWTEARRRGFDPVTDDEADALAILVLKTEGGK